MRAAVLTLLVAIAPARAAVVGGAASAAGRPLAPRAQALPAPRLDGLGGLPGLALPAPALPASGPSLPSPVVPASRASAPRAAQAAGRAAAETPPVLFDDRHPAAGAYATKGFPALRERVLAGVKAAWNLPVEEVLSGRDVLILGESHGSLSSVREVARGMGRLKAAGVTAVGVEGLKAPDQSRVDDYLAGRGALPADAFPSRRAEFSALLEAAKAEGVAVKALGLPLEGLGREIQGRAARREADPGESPARDFSTQLALANARYSPGFNEAVAEVVLTLRNAFMAERLAEAVRGGGKAVALVGAGHAGHPEGYEFRVWGLRTADYGTLAGALKERLVSAFSLTLTGGSFAHGSDAAGHRRLLGPLYSLVESAVGAARAFLPTSEDTGILHIGPEDN